MKSLFFSVFVLLLSVSAFANGNVVESVDIDVITMEMPAPVSDVVVDEVASCTLTMDLTITNPDGTTSTYKGTVTVNTDCTTAIKAFASA
ncbi:MAG: hypothetical protein AB8H12_08595 [Lewinella sp.]